MKSIRDDTPDVARKGAGPTSKQLTAMLKPPKHSSPVTPSPAGQEREALIARASMDKRSRPRSGSYGSRGEHGSTRLQGEVAPPVRQCSNSSSNESSTPTDWKMSRRKTVGTPLLEKSEGVKVEKGAEVVGERSTAEDGSTLVLAFIAMIFVGTGNRVFMKLQTYPMYNYPFFLTMLSTFIYVPVCFAYILPMLAFGSAITPAQRAIPKYKCALMGMLDSVAGIMGVFAVNYIDNAAMIVLLQQAAIPISMSISKVFLGARYTICQYIGATVVIAGIIVTLIPTFFGHPSGGSDSDPTMQIVWSGVQVLSCIPVCLSSVYKEKTLGDDDMDVIYLNGWVAVFQFMASLLFAVPSAYAMGLPINELPLNIYQGMMCFMGHDSQIDDTMVDMAAGLGTVPPDHCETAPFFVSMYLCFNLVYNVVLIVILKYGSANVLFLASTVMVPIGNVAFSLKFVPHHQDVRPSDTVGLLCILTGLVIYRFSKPALAYLQGSTRNNSTDGDGESQTNKISKYIGINQMEYLDPLIQTRAWRSQKARLLRSPEQIRSSFMHRLGLPPSPLVGATTTSRGNSTANSPHIFGRSVPQRVETTRASPGAFRASPGAYRASPLRSGSLTSSAGYSAIPDAHDRGRGHAGSSTGTGRKTTVIEV